MWSLLPGENQLNDAVVRDLADVVNACPLNMGSEKLAERRWYRRVELWTSGDMKASRIRLT
jgi:hypothetical protein